MSRISMLNTLGLVGSFSLAAVWFALRPAPPSAGPQAVARAPEKVEQRAHVTDARGQSIEVKDFKRIASASIVADQVLHALCEPTRIVAYTTHGRYHPMFGHRYAGKPAIEGLKRVEQVLSLKPDLVLMSHFADPRHIARLEAAGITVFDLGEMKGVQTLLGDIRDIADLVRNPEGGARLGRSFLRRLGRVSSGLSDEGRPRAIYLSVYGTKLFGGTLHTGYHDVLEAAGLVDAAAKTHEGWPEFDAESVLMMAPELVVTKTGMESAVCGFPGLSRLPACLTPNRVVGVTNVLIDDPGLGMLDAAEELYARVYGPGGPYADRAATPSPP